MGTVPALTDETPLDQYVATASQTNFTFTFMIFATADIKVYVNDILKTETTDYVVKQADLSVIVPANDLPMDGGKVVFNSGLTVSDKVTLSREIPVDRLTGYSVAGAFRANILNTELTRMQAINQQLERDISRSVRLSPSDSEGGNLDMPTGRASNFLAFDASGNLIVSAGSADSIVVSSFMATVLDDTTAAAARTTLGAQAADDDLTDIAALTVARGDILVGNSTLEWSNLTKGAANFLLKSDGINPSWGFEVLDEDTLSSDSATKLATQQSIKAYVDAISPGLDLLATISASAASTVDFDNFLDSTYETYKLVFSGVTPSTDGVNMYIRIGTGSTPTYQTSNYKYANFVTTHDGGVVGGGGSSQSQIVLQNTRGLGNASGECMGGSFDIFSPASTTVNKQLIGECGQDSNDGYYQWSRFGASWQSTIAITSAQMLPSSGTISGEFRLYGIKK